MHEHDEGKGLGTNVITSIFKSTYKPILEIAYTVQENGDVCMYNDHARDLSMALDFDCFLMIF